MAVPIRCQCGKEYAVPEKRAHKPFKCFVCRRDVVASPELVPQARPAEDRISASPLPSLGAGAQSSLKPFAPPEPLDAKIQEAYAFAFDQVVAGVAGKEIEAKLVKQGLDPEAAQQLVEELEEAHSEVLREAGKNNILFGALWCFGGIVLSVISYFVFTNLGSSRFVVASGAILYGAWRLIRGLGQFADAPR